MPTHDDVDVFLTTTLVGDDPILEATLRAQHDAALGLYKDYICYGHS